MSDIEKTMPIDVLASRVWSGTHWHYPHIETMIAEIERLRAEVAALKHEIDGWRQWDDVDPQIKGECLREARERRIATDAARKENNGNA